MMTCPVCGYRSADARSSCRRCGASLGARVEKTLGDDETQVRAPTVQGRDLQESVPPEVVVELDDSLEDAAEGLRQRALRAGDRDPRHAGTHEPTLPRPDEPRPAPQPARPAAEPWSEPAAERRPAPGGQTERSAPEAARPVAPPPPAPVERVAPPPPAAEWHTAPAPQPAAPPPAAEWLPARAAEPGAPPAGRPYAGFWVRLLAMLVDATVVGGVVLATTLAALLVAGGPGAVIDPSTVGRDFPWLPPLLTLFEVLLGGLYFIYFPGATGSTPGKAALRLEVLRADGQPIGFGAAFVRFLGYGLEMIPGALVAAVVWVLLALSAAFLSAQPRREAAGVWVTLGAAASFFVFLGYLWAAVDPRKQAWHDKLAGTVVVRKG